VVRTIEFGVPISVINLNSFSSTTPVEVALAALNSLRPDPTRSEVEQLIASGDSFYKGLTLELRKRFKQTKSFGLSFRAGYTYSRLTDDGIVNTSDALIPGDFAGERIAQPPRPASSIRLFGYLRHARVSRQVAPLAHHAYQLRSAL